MKKIQNITISQVSKPATSRPEPCSSLSIKSKLKRPVDLWCWAQEPQTVCCNSKHCSHLVSSIRSAIDSAPGVKYETPQVKCRCSAFSFLARCEPRPTQIPHSHAKTMGSTRAPTILEQRNKYKHFPAKTTFEVRPNLPTSAVKQQQQQDKKAKSTESGTKKKKSYPFPILSWQDRQCDVLFQPLFTTQLTSARSIPHGQFLYIRHAKLGYHTR